MCRCKRKSSLLLEEIQRLTSIGILFITHDLRVASQICDRVLVMHQGRIVEEGPVSEVFFAPREDYTRRLLAAAPGRNFSFARSAETPRKTTSHTAGDKGLSDVGSLR